MARTTDIKVRLSDDERQMFSEVARQEGLSVGAALRHLMTRRAYELRHLPAYAHTPITTEGKAA